MFKSILTGILLTLAGTPAVLQAQVAQNCLHASSESAASHARRQQAIEYVIKVNAAETAATFGSQRIPTYRPLNELGNLPPLPTGFDVQFHTDARTYTFSLKDTRDPCRYAIFSDQEKFVYEAIPRSGGQLIPAGTGNNILD